MSWKDDLGQLRLMGPDIEPFRETTRRVWDHIEKLEDELKEWKAEAERGEWPKESAQQFFRMKGALSEIADLARAAKVRQERFTTQDNPSAPVNEAIHSFTVIRHRAEGAL